MSSIDVIVPCYRYGHFLTQCVESVLRQSGPAIRVLVIDDASPDDTSEIASELAQRDRRVTLLRHNSNKGHIATYNEGIDWTSAEYLLLLSADDYLLPGALSRAALLLERHPKVGFVFGNAIVLDEQGERQWTSAVPCHNVERILTSQEFFALSGIRNIVPTPTAVIRTELQKRVGGYRPELPHAGDMEMWLRLATHAPVGFVRVPQAVYRRHGANMSLSYMDQNWLRDLEQRKAVFDFFCRACDHILPDSASLRENLLYLLARDAVSHASMAFNEGQLESCKQLTAFASSINPRIGKSLPWLKLACKRGMGLGLWRALRPVAEISRGLTLFRRPVQTKENIIQE